MLLDIHPMLFDIRLEVEYFDPEPSIFCFAHYLT